MLEFLFKKAAGPLKKLQKETPAQVSSCEFCLIFKNTYFVEHLQTAASDGSPEASLKNESSIFVPGFSLPPSKTKKCHSNSVAFYPTAENQLLKFNS